MTKKEQRLVKLLDTIRENKKGLINVFERENDTYMITTLKAESRMLEEVMTLIRDKKFLEDIEEIYYKE